MNMIPSNILRGKELVHAAELMTTPEGIYTFIVQVTSYLAVILGDANEADLERVLTGIATFKEGEVNPNPALTEAMCNYLRLEAAHGRAESLLAD